MSNYDYQEGSIIEYKTFTGEIRRILVQCREDDIKNGRPGFDGVEVGVTDNVINGVTCGVWGYDSQIVRVVFNPENPVPPFAPVEAK